MPLGATIGRDLRVRVEEVVGKTPRGKNKRLFGNPIMNAPRHPPRACIMRDRATSAHYAPACDTRDHAKRGKAETSGEPPSLLVAHGVLPRALTRPLRTRHWFQLVQNRGQHPPVITLITSLEAQKLPQFMSGWGSFRLRSWECLEKIEPFRDKTLSA